ncbi:hypothetical protein AVEN_77217-1 [Araneus ventricosus]|uniref:Uncharacterized protein n=1 Tax=Araneus ventricosus TaxID=182803 RepID=A0A4Y2TL17_ARAVE|nr:hypothetical protein AVEN_77217-1 [Araneus ventricosus]
MQLKSAPQFQLHKIFWVAVSSTVGLRVERRHHLQSVCLQDVVSLDQADENRLGLSLLHEILWVAVSSTVGLRFEGRHHPQSVCLQDVVLVDQSDENRLGLSLVGQCYSIHLTAQT